MRRNLRQYEPVSTPDEVSDSPTTFYLLRTAEPCPINENGRLLTRPGSAGDIQYLYLIKLALKHEACSSAAELHS